VRTACLLVPDLPLAAQLRAHPECAARALAVASDAGPRATLLSVSAPAARCGVRRGHTLAHARALCGELSVCIASPALMHAAHRALLDAALSFSPRAALAPAASGVLAAEAAVFLDASGVTALFHSEAGFAAALGARARRLGLPATVAIATSRSVARIAARLAAVAAHRETGDETPVQVVPPGAEAAFLAPLPVDALDPDDALCETLTRFGLRCVRDLLALPRRALATRLGPRALQWMTRARGEEVEPPLPVHVGARLAEATDLEHPVDRVQPLLFVLHGLLSRLLARLEVRHLACGDLSLDLTLTSGARDARRVGSAAPTRDLRVLARLVAHALEARPPEAAVQAVHLETEGRPLRSDQLDLFRPAGPAPAALGQTLAELESLCGPQRVGTPAVADTHHPDAFNMSGDVVELLNCWPANGLIPQQFNNSTTSPLPPSPPGGPDFTAALALRVLRPPLPAQVRVRHLRPEWIRSAAVNGRVVRLAGPWRTTGNWWSREERFAFDSFDIQTSDGGVARLRLDHVRRQWQIDAVYD
jgi:protein ImuB